MGNDTNNRKPTTHQRDLAKLPRALAPLIERPHWHEHQAASPEMAASASCRPVSVSTAICTIRNPSTHSIDVWAQNFMQAAVTSYDTYTV